jgi:hypothetical protein
MASKVGLTQELVRYTKFIAVEEPCGKAGWGEIFIRSDLKVAPITGVIWLALEQHVFDALFFGGGNNSTTELEKFEKRMETDEFDVYT